MVFREMTTSNALHIEGIPPIPHRISERIFQYQNTRTAYAHGWMPEGREMIISTRFGDVNQVHYLNHPGGARHQLTFFPEPVGEVQVSPASSRRGFLFSQDIGGGEFYQIFFFDMENRKYKLLTDGQSRNGGMVWANRGDRFAYYSTRRNGRDWDIYIGLPIDQKDSQPVFTGRGSWTPVDWSPDDRYLLVTNYISANESYYYVLDIATGRLTQINPHAGKIAYGQARWAKDGQGIYLTSDEGSEFKQLKYYDLTQNKFTILTGDIPWDVVEIAVSPGGERVAFVANEQGTGKLYLLETGSGIRSEVTEVPQGQIYGLKFHPTENNLALTINSPQTPGDIYVLTLDSHQLTQWTFSEVGGLNSAEFIAPELIHYATFDYVGSEKRMIPAFYYRPPACDNTPVPVLIDIHGGPEGQARPTFNAIYQYFLRELGIAILTPNVRGSSGYGKTYLELDNCYKREDTIQDIGALLNWIDNQPELDRKRIAVMGGSYGGYMVLAAMTHYSDRLKAGIEIVGISNFITFLENTKEYRRELRRVEYGDERDPKMREFLLKISPITNAEKITKPMFIAQGLNDPRVPVGESEQIVSAIRNNGSPVWYLLAKDEGHGFHKQSNRTFYTNAVALFLEEHVLK
ncbi:S9 family peptidase [Candidatus Acetothermia bacterium]|jgi:dipeptidyl aminopeptidase/acylaminoacyl peptidase|nr:S9 family peptidase [Candidatus Acetothermia bacterium]